MSLLPGKSISDEELAWSGVVGLLPYLVACEFYVGIAFVFAPGEVVLAGVGEEVCARDVQEGPEEV